MAKRKGGILLAATAVLGVVAVAAVLDSGGGSNVRKVDAGGGAVSASPAPPAPYAISTLGAIGTAAQDPGGGGGGTGAPGSVGNPTIQGAQGGRGAPGFADGGDTYYLSGLNLLDPNRSATTTGDNTFGGPGAGAAVGSAGTVVGGLDGGGNGSATGCATPPDVDYYSTPYRIPTGFRGTPRMHLRISGGGSVTATVFAKTSSDNCVAVTSGSGRIANGVADFDLGARDYAFPQDSTPVLVISAPGEHTISTGSDNPSFLTLPGLYGV